MLYGVDVSGTWDGAVDWRQAQAAGYSFALVKASEGSTYEDPRFGQSWRGLAEAGLVRGAYHYARPDAHHTGAAEASHFLAILARASSADVDLPPALSLEWSACTLSARALHAWVGDFVVAVEQALGRRPLIGAGALWRTRLAGYSALDCPLWLTEHAPRAQPPAAWSSWTFWQQSARRGSANAHPAIDLYAGDLQDLLAFCRTGTTANRSKPSQAAPTPPEHALASYPGFALHEGVFGPEVRSWQRHLATRSWTIAADGNYGPRSSAVCRRFQALHGLLADGVVGPATWRTTFAETP